MKCVDGTPTSCYNQPITAVVQRDAEVYPAPTTPSPQANEHLSKLGAVSVNNRSILALPRKAGVHPSLPGEDSQVFYSSKNSALILSGQVTWEFKRAHITRLQAGGITIFRKPQPVGAIIERVLFAFTEDLWHLSNKGQKAGINQAEFDALFKDCDRGCAIIYRDAIALSLNAGEA